MWMLVGAHIEVIPYPNPDTEAIFLVDCWEICGHIANRHGYMNSFHNQLLSFVQGKHVLVGFSATI